MKNTKKEMTAEFEKRYAEVSDKAKAVKAKLKEALKDARELSKDAKALYDFGNDYLYDFGNDYPYYMGDDGTLHPAPKWLGNKMDKLELWADCDLGITNAIDYL